MLGQTDSTVNDTAKHISIVFAGDVMGHGPQFYAAFDSNTNKYNYEPCFRYIKPYLNSVNVAIANLEVTFGGKPYTGYPTFSSPDDLAFYLKESGFDILGMANNHCYDKGKRGFERTIKLLDSLKFPHMGTYKNTQMRKENFPFICETNGVRIAFLNYTYGTNGIVVDSPNVVNYINKKKISDDIKAADSLHADIKIAFMHWGLEYEIKPNKEQRELARFMAKEGIDAVVGSHPHVVQTFEKLYPDTADSSRVVPVFYSLGNLVSNQRDPRRDGGAMFELHISKKQKAKIDSCLYQPYWVFRGTLNGKYQYYIIPTELYNSEKHNFPFPLEDAARIVEFEKEINTQFPNLKVSSFEHVKDTLK